MGSPWTGPLLATYLLKLLRKKGVEQRPLLDGCLIRAPKGRFGSTEA